MGTVPVTVVKKDIYINRRWKVDIGRRNYEHGWRCRNHKGWRRRDIDPNIDVHFGDPSI
jgi:hypothetical protein